MFAASSEELAALELYSDLSFLPKGKEEDKDGGDGGSEHDGSEAQKDKPLGTRAMGRQKAKMALLQKQNEELGSEQTAGSKGSKKVKVDEEGVPEA